MNQQESQEQKIQSRQNSSYQSLETGDVWVVGEMAQGSISQKGKSAAGCSNAGELY